ncbi:MAG: hypothetical protein WBA88_15930 [Pseudaminobacter sp.]
MDDDMKITAMGAYLYGALYLVGVFAFGMAHGNDWACSLAVLAAGLAYVSQVVTAFQIAGHVRGGLAATMFIVAIVPAVLAGLSILIGG